MPSVTAGQFWRAGRPADPPHRSGRFLIGVAVIDGDVLTALRHHELPHHKFVGVRSGVEDSARPSVLGPAVVDIEQASHEAFPMHWAIWSSARQLRQGSRGLLGGHPSHVVGDRLSGPVTDHDTVTTCSQGS